MRPKGVGTSGPWPLLWPLQEKEDVLCACGECRKYYTDLGADRRAVFIIRVLKREKKQETTE